MVCDIDWGLAGVDAAMTRGDIVVIVDTLRFSSAVLAAVEGGGRIVPYAVRERAQAFAASEGAMLVDLDHGAETSPSSPSWMAFQEMTPGMQVALVSGSGAPCAQRAAGYDRAFIGCLRNAQAVAAQVAQMAAAEGKNITVVAVGERARDLGLPGGDRAVFAIEDYLACGAILSGILSDTTAEAAVCINAFLGSQDHLELLLRESLAGKRLIAAGWESEVLYCAQLNQSECVPQIRGDQILAYGIAEEAEPVEEEREDILEERAADTPIVREVTMLEVSQQTEEEVSPMPTEDLSHWPAALIQLREQALQCTRCALAETRTNVVFGEGDPQSKLMLIGEGPGDVEDRTGRPFVGRAGRLLDEALRQAGIRRESIWIGNVLKCRACVIDENGRVKNRPPRADEIKACRPWLEAQIEIIQPSVILCIGAPAANLIIHRGFKMTQERGQWFTDSSYAPNVMAALHPAYILRLHGESYESALQSLVEDLKAAWERSQEAPPEKPQLTLF